MGIKASIVSILAKKLEAKTSYDADNALALQEEIFHKNIRKAANTEFGQVHGFEHIKNYSDWKKQVPLRDYEGLKSYIEKIKNGQHDILWPGLPKYFVGTSGTTSGIKYIPLTLDSMPYHLNSARNAVLSYAYRNQLMEMMDHKLIFLSGSPKLNRDGKVPIGRLSGIINHEIPWWLKLNQVPSFETNCIEDWNLKINEIVQETKNLKLSMISGITPWIVMYMEALLNETGKANIKELFPTFQIMVHGGVNYRPYASKLNQLAGPGIHHLETYPASEGFIAFQTDSEDPGLQLNVNAGLFFEFVPLAELHQEQATRLQLAEVELDQDYAIIINSNAGLWGYILGDVVRFVSKAPYRIVFAGRAAHYISAFGEHVIGRDVNMAMTLASKETGVMIKEFSVAPYVSKDPNTPSYHEWFIEFADEQVDIDLFAEVLEKAVCQSNFQYEDLVKGKIIQSLKITALKKDSFRNFMKARGKLGGQNKVPRLANDRSIARELEQYKYE